jgi:hypothetical protein
MTEFVEYNDYTNIRNKFSRFYETFIDKSRNANDIIPFLKNSFEHVDPRDKKNSNDLNLLTINNFSRLQAEALMCKIYNTEVLKSNYATNQTDSQKTGPINSNSRTIGLINFTMGNDEIVDGTPKSQFTNFSTDANNYVIRKSQSKIDLLFSTLVIIEIFIDILEAYKSFIDLDTNNNKYTIEHILIVGKNSRPGPYNNENHGFYLKKKTGQASMQNYEYPTKSTLFLSIKSFNHIKDANKKIFIQNIVLATSQPVIDDTASIFNADKETILRTFTINAVEIKVTDGVGTRYNGEVVSSGEITKLSTANLNTKYDTHDELLGEILKHFLNYIYKINKNDRNIQINALLNYYKIMKCYLLKSVTVGNLLFNTLYNNSQGITTDTDPFMISQKTTSNGSVAIDPIIIDNSTKDNIIIPDTITSPTKDNNYWMLITQKNKTINDKIEELKTEINLSITNNDVTKISEQKPILFQGFLANKVDDETIKISFIDTTTGTGSTLLSTFNSKSANDFLGDLAKYNPINSFEKIYYDSNNTLISNLSNEEKYLNEILQKSSERMNSDIVKQYQLEINRRLYKIVNVTTSVESSNGKSYNKISHIDIKARFDYKNNVENDIDFFKLERNTYQIFENTIPEIAVDIHAIVDIDGKIKVESSLDGKSIILYNFTNNIHPNAENNVIMNKSVDHTDKKANNIRDLREVNNKIILNEMKINNSGRLYEIQDNKYNILNNQLIVYYVIVAIIIAIIVIINISNMEKSLIKTVTTGCFSVIVFLFISYYMVNILYVEGFSNVEHFNITAQAFTYLNGKDEFESVSRKVSDIQSTMTSLEYDISRLFDVLTVSIPQTNFTDTNNMLNNILEGEKNDKIFVNDNLKHSRVNAYNHIDIKKYEIMNIQVLIKAFLYTSFVIFGLYTLQLYIDIKYLDILIFISAILLIIIFTYYIVYSNVIVRTISRNKYWGKEYEGSYK